MWSARAVRRTGVLALLLCLAAAPATAVETPFTVTLGALECGFTRSHLDAVKWRDRYVIGDPFENPRPTVQLVLLTEGWRTLAEPTDDGARPPGVKQSRDQVTVELRGLMSEAGGGPGRWEWRQNWCIERSGLVRLEYTLTQRAASKERWWLHRIQLIGNGGELFIRPPNPDENTPGRPIPVRTREGKVVSPLFGAPDAIVPEPAEVRLPYAGREVLVRPGGGARSVEFWNAWWRQSVNFELPVQPQVETRFEIDLSQLPQIANPALVVAPLPWEAEPWLRARIPPLPPVRPLRFAQCAPNIVAWGEVTRHPEEELERFFTEMSRHFDVMELMVGWSDFRWDLGWERNADARRHAEAIAAEIRKQVRIAHKHGVRIALSLNFGSTGPGTSVFETRRQPHFQGERLDPETGTFHRVPDFYDWASAAALANARKAWSDCARLVGPVDYFFLNETLWRMSPWYDAPLYSEAALADFRRFTRNPRARFPAKPWVPETPRTDSRARPADWRRWHGWVQARFARMVRLQARAFAEANAGNQDYGGAIYFQHVRWTGPEWAVDLNRIAAIPEVTWLVAEYVTDARSPDWRKFSYHAARHRKKLSSFVNIGYYDPNAPGHVRYEGTDAGFEAATRMGLDEHAPMIALYPAESLDPKAPAFHPARTAIWDRLTVSGGG